MTESIPLSVFSVHVSFYFTSCVFGIFVELKIKLLPIKCFPDNMGQTIMVPF